MNGVSRMKLLWAAEMQAEENGDRREMPHRKHLCTRLAHRVSDNERHAFDNALSTKSVCIPNNFRFERV